VLSPTLTRRTAARSSKINTNQTLARFIDVQTNGVLTGHFTTRRRRWWWRRRLVNSDECTLYVKVPSHFIYNTLTSFGYGPLHRHSLCLYVSSSVSLPLYSSLDIPIIYAILYLRVSTCTSSRVTQHSPPPTHPLGKRSLSSENEQGN